MGKDGLPPKVLNEVREWKRRKLSGTIELSFHRGVLKKMRPSPVIDIDSQSEERGHLQVPKRGV